MNNFKISLLLLGLLAFTQAVNFKQSLVQTDANSDSEIEAQSEAAAQAEAEFMSMILAETEI